LFNRVSQLLDILYKFSNGWIWVLTAIAVVAGMFVDVLSWAQTLMSGLSIDGLSIPSNAFGTTAALSSAYALMDSIFPLHEMISCIVLLMPLYLAANIIRVTRAVASLIQVAGTGINN
jgi:hypothetical protein